MRFSQLTLIVLIVMGMFTRYIPVWLGLLTIVVWIVAKLLMRLVIGQIERSELGKQRLAGARLDVHDVVALNSEESAPRLYQIDFTLRPNEESLEWAPGDIVLFQSGNDGPKACLMDTCEMWFDGEYALCGSTTHTGHLRMRVRVYVPEGVSTLVLSYNEERLGSIELSN